MVVYSSSESGGSASTGGGGRPLYVVPHDWSRLVTMRHKPCKVDDRPAWDDTPMRPRPAALEGLRPVTQEPWQYDEDVYNRKFETRDVDVPDRYMNDTYRNERRKEGTAGYLTRFYQFWEGS